VNVDFSQYGISKDITRYTKKATDVTEHPNDKILCTLLIVRESTYNIIQKKCSRNFYSSEKLKREKLKVSFSKIKRKKKKKLNQNLIETKMKVINLKDFFS
jgi:hypothetical protein